MPPISDPPRLLRQGSLPPASLMSHFPRVEILPLPPRLQAALEKAIEVPQGPGISSGSRHTPEQVKPEDPEVDMSGLYTVLPAGGLRTSALAY